MKFAYWMGVQVREGVYRPVFFDTCVLINKSYTLNCSKLEIKSALKVSEIKDREEKIASHMRALLRLLELSTMMLRTWTLCQKLMFVLTAKFIWVLEWLVLPVQGPL